MLFSWIIFILVLAVEGWYQFWHVYYGGVLTASKWFLTDLIFACVMAITAFLIHYFNAERPNRHRDMYMMLAVLTLFYFSHLFQMAVYAQDNWGKAPFAWTASKKNAVVCPSGARTTLWIKGLHVRPIFVQPFAEPVGFHLTVEVYQPTPYIYRMPLSISWHSGMGTIRFSQRMDASDYAGKSLQDPVHLDLYASHYDSLTRAAPKISKVAVESVLHKPEPDIQSVSATWLLTCGGNSIDQTVADQLKKSLIENRDFQNLVEKSSEMYSQYLPENMAALGFKVCRADSFFTYYCPLPKENNLEAHPK
ncbi:MAG: hypothetical protein EPN97_10215, partial [Alphaproteobacteria bacterium]